MSTVDTESYKEKVLLNDERDTNIKLKYVWIFQKGPGLNANPKLNFI